VIDLHVPVVKPQVPGPQVQGPQVQGPLVPKVQGQGQVKVPSTSSVLPHSDDDDNISEDLRDMLTRIEDETVTEVDIVADIVSDVKSLTNGATTGATIDVTTGATIDVTIDVTTGATIDVTTGATIDATTVCDANDANHIKGLKFEELRALLKSKNMDASGKKADMINRLLGSV
jgi:hypothetical protein